MLKAVLGFQELPPPEAEGRPPLALQSGRAAEKAEPVDHSLEQDDVVGWGQSGRARPLSKRSLGSIIAGESPVMLRRLGCCGDNPLCFRRWIVGSLPLRKRTNEK